MNHQCPLEKQKITREGGGKKRKRWCSTAGKWWTRNIGHSEMMLSKLKSDKGKWYGFVPYLLLCKRNLVFLPTSAMMWCYYFYYLLKKKLSQINPNENCSAFHTAKYTLLNALFTQAPRFALIHLHRFSLGSCRVQPQACTGGHWAVPLEQLEC